MVLEERPRQNAWPAQRARREGCRRPEKQQEDTDMTDLTERADGPKKTKKAPSRRAAEKKPQPIKPDPIAPHAESAAEPAPPRRPPEAQPPASLLERLGGEPSVLRLTDQLTALLIADPRVNHTLFGTPRSELHDKIRHLLGRALEVSECDLPSLFSPLIERGFKNGQFSHLLTHLEACLKGQGHAGGEAEQLTSALQQLHGALFNR